MKNMHKDKRAIVSNIILSVGLSAFTSSVFANSHDANGMSAPAVVPEITSAPQEAASNVTSATPEMTKFEFKGVHSLRSETTLQESEAGEIKLMPVDRPPIARNYFQQPPLVPHRIREYKITVRNNKCMSCHSWKNYKKARATKVSQTHFADRDGNAQSTLAARRYFCNQCHVPQVDAKPLVENGFVPVNELNK